MMPRKPKYKVTRTGNPYAPIEFFKGILFIPSKAEFIDMYEGKSRKIYPKYWWRK